MSTKKPKYLNISIGGKLGDEERKWVEAQAKRLHATATWVVLHALREMRKHSKGTPFTED